MADHCPKCGEHLGLPVAAEAVATSAEVEIARIQADRDIQLARIGARTAESDAVTEAVVAVAEAEAAEAAAETVIDALAPGEPEAAEPVIVVADPAGEPEAEPDAPPVSDHHEPPEGEPEHHGYGNPLFFK